MRRKTILWLALVLALVTTAVVSAGDADGWNGRGRFGGPEGMERFHAERFERIAAFLDLNDQQVEDWRALHETHFEGFEAQRREMEALHERIGELAEGESPDAAAIGELVIEVHRKMDAQQREREAIHAEVLSILTPEQRDRFEAMKDLHGESSGRGPWGHGGRLHERHSRHHGTPEVD